MLYESENIDSIMKRDRLRFIKPVKIGDTIRARLTIIDKRLKNR